MKHIVIYVSDHGYGHASRSVALVRSLIQKKKFEITIKNSTAYNFLKTSLPDIKIDKIKTDVGPIYDWSLNNVDIPTTFHNYLQFISNEERWILHESEVLKKKKPDLIITDISPMALRLAKKIKCPTISIANFSWIDILDKLSYDKNKMDVISWLEESFSFSDLTIKLPLSMNLRGFSNIKESALLSRQKTKTRKKIINSLKLKTLPVSCYLADYNTKIIKNNYNTNVINLSNGNLILNDREIKKEFYEGQNIISISQLVIAKIGYGIISECLKFQRPMILISRGNYPENESLRKEVKKFSIGKIIDVEKSYDGIEIPTIEQIYKLNIRINKKSIQDLEKKPKVSQLIIDFLK